MLFREEEEEKVGLTTEILKGIMESLGEKRPVFHSEADFQFELAWAIKEAMGEECQIRLEYPVFVNENLGDNRGDRWYIDIIVLIKDGENWDWIPIELKYKTRIPKNEEQPFTKMTHGIEEDYYLKNQSAQDISRYLFWKDVHRVESLVKPGSREKTLKYPRQQHLNWNSGYVIFLSNDPHFRKYPEDPEEGQENSDKMPPSYRQFSMIDGTRTQENITMHWTKNNEIIPKEESRKDKSPIDIKGAYEIKWGKYSGESSDEDDMFKYVCLEIKRD